MDCGRPSVGRSRVPRCGTCLRPPRRRRRFVCWGRARALSNRRRRRPLVASTRPAPPLPGPLARGWGDVRGGWSGPGGRSAPRVRTVYVCSFSFPRSVRNFPRQFSLFIYGMLWLGPDSRRTTLLPPPPPKVIRGPKQASWPCGRELQARGVSTQFS